MAARVLVLVRPPHNPDLFTRRPKNGRVSVMQTTDVDLSYGSQAAQTEPDTSDASYAFVFMGTRETMEALEDLMDSEEVCRAIGPARRLAEGIFEVVSLEVLA
jgi:hypothetical protein